jgi:hypothetical protein
MKRDNNDQAELKQALISPKPIYEENNVTVEPITRILH